MMVMDDDGGERLRRPELRFREFAWQVERDCESK
jgi:hypothetical protein